VNGEALSRVRRAVCSLGSIRIPFEEYLADPTRGRFEIMGTGFLVEPMFVLTCGHVVAALDLERRKSGERPYGQGAEFGYPDLKAAGEWTTAIRPFEVVHSDERTDLAVLKLTKGVEAEPVAIATEDFIPLVGDPIGLCGYPHGSKLTTRGSAIDRVGPLVQTGIVAALSPFETKAPDRIVMDLATGGGASGSPIFRPEDGVVIGFLMEGQVGPYASFSIARTLFRDSQGRVNARLRTGLEVTKKSGG
jgi:S1-C subfamily serine protease